MKIRYVAFATGMAVAWVTLWDTISFANFVGGLVVAAVLLVAFPLRRTEPADRRIVHPVALARLALYVLRDIIISNVHVSRQIVARRQQLNTGIVACPMRTTSSKVFSTVANAIVLSPGTMAVDATADPPTLYIHVLTIDDVTEVRSRVARLERLVVDALGSAADRVALDGATTSGEGGS